MSGGSFRQEVRVLGHHAVALGYQDVDLKALVPYRGRSAGLVLEQGLLRLRV